MFSGVFDAMMERLIGVGRLNVVGPAGRGLRSFGPGDGGPEVTIHIHDPGFPVKVLRSPEMALGDGYMDERLTIEDDDLHGLLELLLRNRSEGNVHWAVSLNLTLRRLKKRLQQNNPLHRARANVAHHYDLSGALYDLFLDEDRQYSCAYFSKPGMTLEEAQAAKKAHIAGKLLLEPGMRVLDIGCGWGGMALTLARDFGANVVGVTLSKEQHAIATRRVEEAGMQNQVEIRLQDYRKVRDSFDRVVSVGMFEHVGVPHYREYFGKVRDLTGPDGVALIHTIGRCTPPGATSPWIDKYIFPGGYTPAMSEMMAAVEKEGLWSADMEVWRMHYAYTLRHWYDRFMENIDKAEALYDARFCRMWRYYLAASEQSFRYWGQVVFQLQLAKRPDVVPVTRNYLYASDERASLAAE